MMRITLAALCLLLSVKSFASHVSSAEIRYEYTGNANDYRIYLTVFKACEPGNAVLAATESVSFSSSCAVSFTVPLPVISIDTLQLFCGNNIGSCSVVGSVWPGYERRIFSGIVSFPPCVDWTMKWSLCCRNAGIVNIANPSGVETYVESFLNNSAAINSSAYIVSTPNYFIVQSALNTVPLQTVDAEDDSLVFEWYQPMSTAALFCNYAVPYTLNNPIGGQAIIDPVNQTLILQAALQGKYALALKVKEYRNGILVGSTFRDFQIAVLGGTNPLTVPMPVPGTNMNYITCPGQSNSVTVNFVDSTATDSVYLDVTTPNLSGWTFNATINNGTGGASTTVTWTTPSTMNPGYLTSFLYWYKSQGQWLPGACL